ncbi:MAG: ABC transporter ATP-binding protein [Candidatus Rokubacteria bacterium]|nr:ABC transporter ATP-binding protein [Candidatus Rokubacteria bacterium]
MLAVARGLMARPRVLLLDEPSLGVAPILVREIFAAIERLRTQGVTVLLVEQMAAQALALADRAYVLDRGRITLEGPAQEVRNNPAVVDAYLGRHADAGAP